MPVKKAFGAHRSDEYNGTHAAVYMHRGPPLIHKPPEKAVYMMNKIKCIFLSFLMILMASSPLFLTNEPGNLLDNASKFNSDETNSDLDGDGFTNAVEEDCGSDPSDSTSIPEDSDSDGTCDILDDDIDGDSWSNDDELTCGSDPTKASSIPEDGDGDGFCDVMDAFPDDELEWVDSDNDGTGDNRDTDDDNDGVDDDLDVFPDYPCAAIDTDNDGFPDSLISWNCKTILQADWDDDNDGVFDSIDAFPLDACFAFDTDDDGLPDDVLPGGECDPSIGTDLDDDNDGWADIADAFPLNPREWADQDFDGIGNNEDINDDGDGWSDLFEDLCETDPLSPASYPLDTDGDGLCDLLDPDDDNDGVPDDQDTEPLNAAGSWEWATGTGDMIEINDMVMDSNGDILVTGSYRGQTSLGTFTLEQHNKEDAFVAKMDNQGNWLWVETTASQPKMCANSKGPEYTTNSAQITVTEFVYTGLIGFTNHPPAFPNWDPLDEASLYTESIDSSMNGDATQHFSAGDYVYDNGTSPPTFIGIVDTVTANEIDFTDYISHYATSNVISPSGQLGMELVKFNLGSFQYNGSLSISLNNGDMAKKIWEDSFAISNAIDLDEDGNAYITGNFDGFVKFEKSGFDDVIESYNVRNEGNWMRKSFIQSHVDADGEQIIKPNLNSYPCGAPSDHLASGFDMFVAKISSDGDWEWAVGAGSSHSDTGDSISLSVDGKHAWVSGNLQQDWASVPYPIQNGINQRNEGCAPSNHVKKNYTLFLEYLDISASAESHAGMFNSITGVQELSGCGAYIAKIKLSNGKWKDALEISPPSPELAETGAHTTLTWAPYSEYNPHMTCHSSLNNNPNGLSTCSDKYLTIRGIFEAGSPERLYVVGEYAGMLEIGGFSISTNNPEDVRGFMAKYEPSTGNWVWLKNGCGAAYTKCYQIHDVVNNGIWHYFTSGCYHNQKFVAKYDFDGNEIWMEKFGAKCDYTELAIDDNGDVYVAGAYTEQGHVINIGSTQLRTDYSLGHYVAHIDTNGNWIWAEDSEHVHGWSGHGSYDRPYTPSSNNCPNDPCRTDLTYTPHGKWGRDFNSWSGASKPTGIVVDSNSVVYVGGWINGVSYFKNEQLVGISSYVAAISEPLQAPDDPVILVNPEDNSIPSISMLSSILVAVGAATIWKPKKRDDENQVTDQ